MLQRVERMRGGEAERNAEAFRPPGAPAVGPAPLGRNLGGTLLPPVVEQARKEHRLVGYASWQLPQPVERDIRVRRNEIEVPINGDGHGGEDRKEGKRVDGYPFSRRSAQCDGSGKRGRSCLCF